MSTQYTVTELILEVCKSITAVEKAAHKEDVTTIHSQVERISLLVDELLDRYGGDAWRTSSLCREVECGGLPCWYIQLIDDMIVFGRKFFSNGAFIGFEFEEAWSNLSNNTLVRTVCLEL